MIKDIQAGWLENKEDELFAPKTLMDLIQDNDGTSLKEYIETHGGSSGSSEASEVTYSNTKSGLAATNVQDAIDEMQNEFDGIDIILDYILNGTVGDESNIYKVFNGIGIGEGGVLDNGNNV